MRGISGRRWIRAGRGKAPPLAAAHRARGCGLAERHQPLTPTLSPGRGSQAAGFFGRTSRQSEAGFTLIELLVVMVILVLLASLVAPRVMSYLGSSRTKTAKVQIESLSTALELFKLDAGRYPSGQEGLQALVERPSDVRGWNGSYLQKDRLPADPWGRSYRYRFPGESGVFDIFSLGADDKEGGEGEDQDVANWM